MAEQLAASVDVRLNAKVDAVREGSIDVNGETLAFDSVVVAVDGPALPKLLPDLKPVQARASTCVYFSLDAKDLPTQLPIILLIPDDGPLNNVCFPSNVQASYAPEGRALCSATIIDSLTDVPDDVEAAARSHLATLFPDANVGSWTFERLYRVPFAQPRQQLDKPDSRGLACVLGLYIRLRRPPHGPVAERRARVGPPRGGRLFKIAARPRWRDAAAIAGLRDASLRRLPPFPTRR